MGMSLQCCLTTTVEIYTTAGCLCTCGSHECRTQSSDGKNDRSVLDYPVNFQNITPNDTTKLEWQTNNYSWVRRYAQGLIKEFTTLKTKENRTE